jgi:hypothetical protein
MELSPSYNDILIQPDRSPVTNPILCTHCGARHMTAFGYVDINDAAVEGKPMVYFADWVPTHADAGVTLIVGRGEFQGDEAANMRAMAFSLKPYKDGLNIELVDASQTSFAEFLRHVFSVLMSVADAKKNPELDLYHSIAIRVLSEEPRLTPYLKSFSVGVG